MQRQAIIYNRNDMHEQASGFESVENVVSDMENSTKYAKEMILQMQESNNLWLRSLQETIQSMQSKLRQTNNMYENLNNQFQHVVAANWFLNARIGNQEETIQKKQGIYEELLKEYENLKSKISVEHSRQPQIEPDRQSADHSNDEINDTSRNVGKEMISRQQLDQMTREHNAQLNKLKTEKELLEKMSELLEIAKSPGEMMKVYVNNEKTLAKEMDLLIQDLADRDNEIKELKLSVKSVKYQSNEDRNKLHRQLQRKEGTIVILKKQKHLLQTRLNTVQETVELLKQEAFVTTGVISEPSQRLKQLIDKNVQLEDDYKKTQQDLQNHERLCSDHGLTTPIELFEENIPHAEVAEVLRGNTILQTMSTIYDQYNNFKLQRKEGTIVILKKQKHLLQTRLNSLKQFFDKDVQLENDYKKTQQDLQNHERLCSDHGLTTPIELFEENIPHAEVAEDAEVLHENTILQDISTIYDRLQPDETSSLQGVPGSHDALDPLKIPDLYQNLYDNHWRDAIKAENIIDDDMRLEKTFLELFENVCAFCTDIFETQKMVKIKRLKQESTDGCYPDESRVLELMRNETTEFSLNEMYQIFNQRGMMRTITSLIDKSLFVKESIRICWLMNLSDPPVLVHKNIKSGDRFDPNFYEPYTCKGKKVDFVVFPALVRMDGLVIAKGIVECEPLNRRNAISFNHF